MKNENKNIKESEKIFFLLKHLNNYIFKFK